MKKVIFLKKSWNGLKPIFIKIFNLKCFLKPIKPNLIYLELMLNILTKKIEAIQIKIKG